MANNYKVSLTDENIKDLMDDPEMDGITIEAISDEGSKVMITLTKGDAVSSEDMPMEEMPPSEEDVNAEVGNIAPEEQAAMDSAEMAQESIGFTNESTIRSFDNFLKTL
jgi:hypothetical protein